MKRLILNGLLLALCTRAGLGQLAITEVMSSSSTNLGALAVPNGPDFWELTNFGTNTINLDRYTYSDSLGSPRVSLVQTATPPLLIEPGESVLFVRTDVNAAATNEPQFRAWWGLAPGVKVRMMPRMPGFDAQSDGVRLYDAAGHLLDRVDFGISRRGVTFVYDTNSSEFGVYSQLGICGTRKAELADDIGSPGATCGPVSLRILAQPTNIAVCAGMDAAFMVRAGSLPRPRYQWYFNSVEIPGAAAATLIITNAAPADEGVYEVEIDNGAAVLRSAAATLAVGTIPAAPTFAAPPSDSYVIAGQTARFSATVCAYPVATYQWHSNGVIIAEATDRTLVIRDCSLSMSGSEYCVKVTNPLGMTSACARLTVTLPPKLEITEMMPAAHPDCAQHADWFELTNRGTNVVNLRGYRFADRFPHENEAFPSENAPVVSIPVIVRPGESAIFVERMTADEFRRWWGAERLPPELPIITYIGLGFSQALGDALYLWSPGAEDPFDVIASISFASATPGLSLDFTENTFGEDSVPGERGAFVAIECGDIGSPGYVTNPPPRFVRISHDESTATMKWSAIVGRTYQLKYKESLDAEWQDLVRRTAKDWVETHSDPTEGWPSQRFYFIEEQP